MRTSTVFTIAGLASSVTAGYTLQEDFMSGNFFDHFDFFNSPDPTHGFVNYVDAGTANAQGYVNTQKGAYIGVDSKNVASSSGRDSVRLTSKTSTTEALIILDLAHMPGGIAGTWPAFWTVGPDWPNNGEVDIIEGVNSQNTNFMTIHSGSQACQMASTGAAALSAFSSNCWNQFDGNEGCSYHDTNTNTYGAGFNAQGGGVFAMEHTGNVISVWYFGRNDDLSQVLSDNPDPTSWPAPRAQWLSTSNQFGSCDLSTAVQQQSIVFDTTFCGDWAGNVYPGGPSACQSFVQNNPSAFEDAYWQVNSLKVFTSNGQSTPSSSSVSSPATSSPATSSASSSSASSISTLTSSTAAAASSSVSSASVSSPAAPTTPSTPASVTTTPASTLPGASPSSTETAVSTSLTAESSSSVASASPTTPAASSITTTATLSSSTSVPATHHHHSKHRQSSVTNVGHPIATSFTTQVVVSTTVSGSQPTTTDIPEVVVVGPDGVAYEEPETIDNGKRSIPMRQHGRQFLKSSA